MSYLEKTSLRIISPKAVNYKPMRPNINAMIEAGALVHMFEFPLYLRDKDSPRDDNFKNFINAMKGRSTGLYSCFKTGEGREFNEGLGVFQAMACSGIKAGYPMQLYDVFSEVGVLINPNKVKFLVVQNQDCSSVILNENQFRVSHANIFNDQALHQANFSDARIEGENAVLPFERSEEKYNELKNIFHDHFWRGFSGGSKPGDQDFNANIAKSIVISKSNGVAMLTEIVANVPPEAIEAVIIYTEPKCGQPAYDRTDKGARLLMANMVREKIKIETNIDLPIINYHSNLRFENEPYVSATAKFEAPLIREVNIENNKVKNILNKYPETKASYQHYLGQKYVQDIFLGKVGAGVRI